MRYKYFLYYFIFVLFISACGGSGGSGDSGGSGGNDDNGNGGNKQNTVSFSLNGSKVTGLSIDSNDMEVKNSLVEVTLGVSNTITTLKIGILEIAKINTEELKNIIPTSGTFKNSVIELLDYLSFQGLTDDDAKDSLLIMIEAIKSSIAQINDNAWRNIHKDNELNLNHELFTEVSAKLKTLIGDSPSTIDKEQVVENLKTNITKKITDYVADNSIEPSITKREVTEKLQNNIRWEYYKSTSFAGDSSYQSITSKISSRYMSTINSVWSNAIVLSIPKPIDDMMTGRDYIVDIYIGNEPFYINHPDENYRNFVTKDSFNVGVYTEKIFNDLTPNTKYYFNMVLKYINKSGIAVTTDVKVQGYAKTFPENIETTFSENITMNATKVTAGATTLNSLNRRTIIKPDFGYSINPKPKFCQLKQTYEYHCAFFRERVAYVDEATFKDYGSSTPLVINAEKMVLNPTQIQATCENVLNQNSEASVDVLNSAESGIIFLKNQYRRDAAHETPLGGSYPYGHDKFYSFHPKHFYAFKEDATEYPKGAGSEKFIVKDGYPKILNECVYGAVRGSTLNNTYAIGEQPSVDYTEATLQIQESDYYGDCNALDSTLTIQAIKCPAFTAYKLRSPPGLFANYITLREYTHLPKKIEIGVVGKGDVFVTFPSRTTASKIFEVITDDGNKQVFTLDYPLKAQKWSGAYFSLNATDATTAMTWDTSGDCVFRNKDYSKCYFDFSGPIFKADATFYKESDVTESKNICDNARVLTNEYQRDASYRMGVDDISIEDSRLPVATDWYTFYEEINSEHGVTRDGYVNLHQGECLQMLQGPAVYSINIANSSTLPSKLFEKTNIDLMAKSVVDESVVCVDINTVLDSTETPDFQAKALQCIDKTVYFLARPLKDKTAHATDRTR